MGSRYVRAGGRVQAAEGLAKAAKSGTGWRRVVARALIIGPLCLLFVAVGMRLLDGLL